MGSGPIHFVAPSGDMSAEDRMQHIAIQATAVMLQPWFEEEAPTPEKAGAMIDAVIRALRGKEPVKY